MARTSCDEQLAAVERRLYDWTGIIPAVSETRDNAEAAGLDARVFYCYAATAGRCKSGKPERAFSSQALAARAVLLTLERKLAIDSSRVISRRLVA